MCAYSGSSEVQATFVATLSVWSCRFSCYGYSLFTAANEERKNVWNHDHRPLCKAHKSNTYFTLTTAAHTATLFVHHWTVPYEISDFLPMEESPQLLSTCFATLWGFVGLKHMKIMSYRPLTNAQTERYNKIIGAYCIM